MDNRRLLSPTGSTLDPLEKSIYQQLKKYRGQLNGQVVLAAVSGGIDSVVLLHVLAKLKSRLGFELHCGHVNHGIRGRHSDEDSLFVADLCRRLEIQNMTEKLAGLKPTASENTLRIFRYRSLRQMAKKLGAVFIATAHHHDDQLETRLMRLLQGTGAEGLKAMTVLGGEGLLRPLLTSPRREIEIYARDCGLKWRTDTTNADTQKLRNWIRHEWLGILRRDHPEYLNSFHQSLERLVEEGGSSNGASADVAPLFDRTALVEEGANAVSDKTVYSYLRQYAKKRVTAALVKEFKKQLVSRRKNFTFRLAGVEWKVARSQVSPT